MAEAKKIQADYKVELILDREEAETLRTVLSNISGERYTSHRGVTDRINQALSNACVHGASFAISIPMHIEN